MDNSRTMTLAWSVADTCLSPDDARLHLGPLGLIPEPLPPSGPYETEAALAVLHSSSFGDLPELAKAMDQLSKPGLVVVDSAREETQVLEWGLPLYMDICQAEVLPEQLGYRLKRILDGIRSGLLGTFDNVGEQVPHKQVHNRAYLDIRLPREFDSARKHCRSLAIAWINLTQLDPIARADGESAVRQFVNDFARTVFANIRVTDWLARYSHDEFCLVMPDTWLDEGREVAARIREAVSAAKFRTDGPAGFFAPGISVGVAELTDDETGYEDLIHTAAEAALMEKLSAIKAGSP